MLLKGILVRFSPAHEPRSMMFATLSALSCSRMDNAICQTLFPILPIALDWMLYDFDGISAVRHPNCPNLHLQHLKIDFLIRKSGADNAKITICIQLLSAIYDFGRQSQQSKEEKRIESVSFENIKTYRLIDFHQVSQECHDFQSRANKRCQMS